MSSPLPIEAGRLVPTTLASSRALNNPSAAFCAISGLLLPVIFPKPVFIIEIREYRGFAEFFSKDFSRAISISRLASPSPRSCFSFFAELSPTGS